MRFYCLTLQNINSLKGKWLIDFEQLHGIFSILGATGAGKSSLLDALCLAIYGATPRLGKITKTDNALMSLGTGACMAQAEVGIKGKRYRFYFGQKRAKKSPTGNLQDPKHEIFAQNDLGEFHLISQKRNESEKLAVQILGMDFAQFTRSVLLAQGGFSAFLQANTKERGEILEHITGSEIYAQIGKQVHQMYVQKQDELELITQKLQNIGQHTPISVLAAQLKDTRHQHDKLSQQAQTLTQALLARQSYDTLMTQKHAQEQSLAQTQQAQTQFDGDAVLLKNAQNHRLLLPDHEAVCALYEQKTKQKQLFEQTCTALKDHEYSHQKKSLYKDETNKRHAQTEQDYFAWQPILQAYLSAQNTLQSLHQQYQEKQDDLKHTQNASDLLHQKIQELDANVAKTKQNLESLQPILSKLEAQSLTLKDHDARTLEHNIAQSLAQQQKLLHLQNQLSTVKAQHKEAKKHHEQACIAHAHAQNTLTKPPLGHELQHSQERVFALEQDQKQLNNLKLCQENLHKTQAQHQRLACTLEQLKQEQILADNKLQALKYDYEIAKNNHEHQKQIATLNAQIKTLKDALCDGTPCPLCGSTTHPDKSMPKVFLDDSEQHKNQSHALLLAQQSLAQQLKEQADELSSQQKACQSRLGLLNEQLLQTLAQISLKPQTTDLVALQETLSREYANALEQLQNLKHQEHQHQTQKQALLESQTNLKLAQLEQQTLFVHLQQIQESHRTLSDECSRLGEQILTQKAHLQAILPSFAITSEKSDALMQAFDALLQGKSQQANQLPLFIKDLHKLFDECQEAYQETKHKQNRLKEQYKLFCQRKQDVQQEQQRQQAQLDAQKTALSHTQIKLQQAQKKLESFEVDAQAHNQTLQQTLKQAKQTAQEAWQEWQHSHDTLQSLQEQLKAQNQALIDTKQALEQKQDSFNKKRQQFFASHGDFLAAAMDEPRYQHLLHTKDKLNHEKNNALYALEQINQKLKSLPKDQPEQSCLQQELEYTKDTLNLVAQELGVMDHAYKDALLAEEQISKIKSDIAKSQDELSNLMLLHHLIGSYDGKKYRNFAQGLTLNALLYEANKVLATLTDRYTLIKATDDSLSVCVIDGYQENNIRHSKNLSGGESFLVSLALALGLSALSSQKTNIDSLFLDEGFGTLDEESLDIALSALNQMHAQGKTIGIISHVPALKERIGQQIWVVKQSGGKSTLTGAGVQAIATQK